MFAETIGDFLNKHKSFEEVSEEYPELGVNYLGIRETKTSFDVISFVDADGLKEKEILFKIERLYNSLHGIEKFNSLKMPNGLVCFVFRKSCGSYLRRMIPKMSRINHSMKKGRWVVPWIIELEDKKITTHSNPISWIPPVYIKLEPPWGLYPGLNSIDSFLQTYSIEQNQVKQKQDRAIVACYAKLEDLVLAITNLIENGEIKKGLIKLKSSISFHSDKYSEIIVLLFRFNRLKKMEVMGTIEGRLEEIAYNKLVYSILESLKEINDQDLKANNEDFRV